jgi:WD40 repeat protein/uncharacterized cupredoxin-like copper-binding protein/energy-coupling factor transporter ATP-binding protein EcfA2
MGMVMDKQQHPDTPLRFPSLSALRESHTGLLKQYREQGGTDTLRTSVEAFLNRACATGALLDNEDDRWAVQSMLDYWATTLYEVGQSFLDVELAPFDPMLAPEIPEDQCPYMGLEPFQEGDNDLFFGRQRLVGEMVAHLQTQRLLAIVGPSGSGKSSLVLAGLLGKLHNGAIKNSDTWSYLPRIVPGSHPLENLARMLYTVVSQGDTGDTTSDEHQAWIAEQCSRLQQDPTSLHTFITEHLPTTAVLIVDQFEETFTLCQNPAIRQPFLDSLLHVCQHPDTQHRVILTMRSDFETFVARVESFHTAFEQAQMRVTPLSADEMREAIEKPAEKVGLKFEQGVVEELLQDILGEPAALPLLQFTLWKLWQNRERNRVTMATYRKLGGGRKALSTSADAFYNNLIPEEQVTARRILLQMVRPGQGLEVTSNRIPKQSLYRTGEAQERIDRVLDTLIAERLVRLTARDVLSDEQVEVAHEALVRNWPLLVDWLEEERAILVQLRRWEDRVADWETLGRGESGLLDAGELSEVERQIDTFQTRGIGYSKRLEKFVQQSKVVLDAEQRKEEQRQKRKFQMVTSAIIVLIVLLALTSWFGWQASVERDRANAQQQTAEAERDRASQNEKLAVSRQLLVQAGTLKQNDFDLKTLLHIQADNITSTVESQNALLEGWQATRYLSTTLHGHTDEVGSVAFSPDGQTLASGAGDNTIRLWDMTHDPPILQATLTDHTNSVSSVAFSPDGQTLVSAGWDEPIIVWDMTQNPPSPKAILTDHKDTASSLAFSPDGQTLVSGSWDDTIIVWDMTQNPPSPKATLTDHEGSVYSFAFSPDGQTLASGAGDNTIRLWDMTQNPPSPKATLTDHEDYVSSLAFSPDGQTLVSGGRDRDDTIIVWDMTQNPPSRKATLTDYRGFVYSLVFSPDGQTLASKSYDDTIIVWDMTHDPPSPKATITYPNYRRYGTSITNLTFSPDGKTLASGLYDGTIRLWDITNPDLPAHETFSDTTIQDWKKRICFGVNRNLTLDEWQKYMGDDKQYQKTCPGISVHTSVLEPGDELARAGDIEGAIAYYEEIRELDSTLELTPTLRANQVYAGSLVEEGETLAQAGDFISATLAFSEALRFDPTIALTTSAQAWVVGGETLASKGDIPNATLAFSEALRFDSTIALTTSAQAWVVGGETLAGKGDIPNATYAFSEALRFDPTLDIVPTERVKQTHLHIAIKGEELAFDIDTLAATVAERQPVYLHFHNTSQTQEHTWILFNHHDMDKAEAFYDAAMSAVDTKYMPLDDDALMQQVIGYIPVLQPGESGEVTFTAPPPGEYLYICTVPGHFPAGDYGTLTITAP